MAVTGTSTFTVTRDDVIGASLRLLGVLEAGVTPDSTTLTNVSLVLNMMIKDWQIDGIKLWSTTELTLPLVANQTVYKIGPSGSYDLNTDRPLRLIQSFLRNTGVTPNLDIPMVIISEQEYNLLGSKYSTGQINSVFYKPLRDYGQVTLFLTPDTNISSNYQLHLTVQRGLYDMNSGTDNFDFPQEWYNALRWGLAAELIGDYGIPEQRASLIVQRAMYFKDRLVDWDIESTSTMFVPDLRMASIRPR